MPVANEAAACLRIIFVETGTKHEVTATRAVV
jgi:hypothetical protein